MLWMEKREEEAYRNRLDSLFFQLLNKPSFGTLFERNKNLSSVVHPLSDFEA